MRKALHPYFWIFSLSANVSIASNTNKNISVPSSRRRIVILPKNTEHLQVYLLYTYFLQKSQPSTENCKVSLQSSFSYSVFTLQCSPTQYYTQQYALLNSNY